jgi:hypothetical protein
VGAAVAGNGFERGGGGWAGEAAAAGGVEWKEGEEERRDAEAEGAEAQGSAGIRRMENREPDVGIAVGALQPYPCTIIMR